VKAHGLTVQRKVESVVRWFWEGVW
jgi:hypothetical protein